MTLFIAFVLLWEFDANGLWYALASAVWALHLLYHAASSE